MKYLFRIIRLLSSAPLDETEANISQMAIADN